MGALFVPVLASGLIGVWGISRSPAYPVGRVGAVVGAVWWLLMLVVAPGAVGSALVILAGAGLVVSAAVVRDPGAPFGFTPGWKRWLALFGPLGDLQRWKQRRWCRQGVRWLDAMGLSSASADRPSYEDSSRANLRARVFWVVKAKDTGVEIVFRPGLPLTLEKVEQAAEASVTMIPGAVAVTARQASADAFGIAWWFETPPDPLGRTVPYALDAPVSTERVPFAVDENGEPVHLRIAESNVLFGGEPGGGKSGGQTALIAGLARLPNVALVGLDPKRVELSPWRERFTRVAVEPQDCTRVLAALVDEMEKRYDFLEMHHRKKLTTGDFTAEMPLIALVIDELAELLATGLDREGKQGDTERAVLLRRLIAKGRAAGMFVSAATQKPAADTVPTSIRDLIAQRVAFRTGTREMTETIIGSGRAEGGPAHLIDVNARGVAWVIMEGQAEPRRVRVLWLADEDVPAAAAATAHLRPSFRLEGTDPSGSKKVAAS